MNEFESEIITDGFLLLIGTSGHLILTSDRRSFPEESSVLSFDIQILFRGSGSTMPELQNELIMERTVENFWKDLLEVDFRDADCQIQMSTENSELYSCLKYFVKAQKNH
jgi:hypothetical protein